MDPMMGNIMGIPRCLMPSDRVYMGREFIGKVEKDREREWGRGKDGGREKERNREAATCLRETAEGASAELVS